jgi:hypothetical protein
MKVMKNSSVSEGRSPLRSVSLQIRDYQVTVKVHSAVPQARPQIKVRGTAPKARISLR